MPGCVITPAENFQTTGCSIGRREVLGIAIQPSEAEVFWDEFLRSLADRGLRGVKLIIADDIRV